MRPSFNVLNDPWIPVVAQDGERSFLGIRETLRRASELKEISVVSPLEEFSVYRFLCVFLMAALRPEDRDNIEELLDEGNFDMEQIEAYIFLCEEEGVSFDLFDEQRPFMQAAFLREEGKKEAESAARLDLAHPTGNNHIHFEHGKLDDYSLTFAEALPKMLSANLFAVKGGSGYQPSINGKPPYMILINGENLFQTLCFMFVALGEHKPLEVERFEWMKVKAVEKGAAPANPAFFQSMIYPVRSILLLPDDQEQVIKKVYYSKGCMYDKNRVWRDPNVGYQAYRGSNKEKQGEMMPVFPEEDIAPWRNYVEFLRTVGRQEVVSRYLKYDLVESNVFVTLYGVCSDEGSYKNTVRCSLRIPVQILGNPDCEDAIHFCIEDSKSVGDTLQRAMRIALKNERIDAKGKSIKPTDAKVKETANVYYTRCEEDFWTLIQKLGAAKSDELMQVMQEWRNGILIIALDVYNNAVSSIQANGKTLRQIALGEDILRNWSKPKGGKKR